MLLFYFAKDSEFLVSARAETSIRKTEDST